MSSFDRARLVEAEGLAILRPFLDERVNGRLIMLDKGPLARALQQSTGDAIFQCPQGRVWSVEIKVEEKHTGNLFLESWSNRNLESVDVHVALGSNPGWMFKLKSDLLMYYFLDTDQLYVMDFFRLKRWAFLDWQVAAYREKPQGKYPQPNDAWGWCVPVTVLARELGKRHFKMLNPKELATKLPFPGPLAHAAAGLCPF
jgi:hypothetical protein